MTTTDAVAPSDASGGLGRVPGGALRILGLYLGLALVPLLLGVGAETIPLWLPVVHIAGMVWVGAVIVGRTPEGAVGRTLAHWTPLLLLPLLYVELPALMEGLGPGPVVYHDAFIQVLEGALFGGQPAWQWAGAMPWTPLSELLHLCYLLFYPLIFVPPLLMYLRERASGEVGSAGFHETVLALTMTWVVCYAVMIVMPVQGPRYLGVPPGIPEGPLRALTLSILESGSSRGAAFPSSHVAIAVAQVVATLRWRRTLGLGVAAVTVGLSAGAVYGGFHYASDALAGALVGLVCAAAAVGWSRGGAVASRGLLRRPRP